MTYCFILGRVPGLSLLEIHAILTRENISFSSRIYSSECLLVTTKDSLDLHTLQRNLGGSIKIAIIHNNECSLTDYESSVSCISDMLLASVSKKGRITFGLNAYTVSRHEQKVSKKTLSSKILKSLGLKIKKKLKDEGYSIRFVSSENGVTLSSVQTEKNGLLKENGREFILLEQGKKILIGTIETVQDFEEYSFRDYNRPYHDMEIGLLPPKVAQIMINISGTKGIILDPFCGFGTVLQEALLMGFPEIRGSDIEPKNVHATQKNLAWLSEKKSVPFKEEWITQCDAMKLSSTYSRGSIDAVITEPYLGPKITAHHSVGQVKKIAKEVSHLYVYFFKEAFHILKRGGVIVVVWPVWMEKHQPYFLPIYDDILALGYTNTTIPLDIAPLLREVTSRDSLLYRREGQFVARELFVFQKK